MPTWVQLADGSWINMANVNSARRERNGQLRLEFIGEHGIFVDQHRRIGDPRDVALIEAYLAQTTFRMYSSQPHQANPAFAPDPPTPPLPRAFPSDGMHG